MPKNIHSYLPEKEETSLVQAPIAASLKEAARAKMKVDKITWADLITAGVKTYLNDDKKSKKK